MRRVMRFFREPSISKSHTSIICAFVLGVLLALSLKTYMRAPVTGDIFVFLSSARLGDIQYGGGIGGSISSWEIKQFANRIHVSVLYSIASMFQSFSEREHFVQVVRAVNLSMVLGVSVFLGTVLSSLLNQPSAPLWRKRTDFLSCILACACALLSFTFRDVLQAEYNALIVTVCGIGFLVLFDKYKGGKARFAFGLLAVLMFAWAAAFKFTAIVLPFQAVLLHDLAKRREPRAIVWRVAWVTTACILFIGVWCALRPAEYFDFADALQFQGAEQRTFATFWMNSTVKVFDVFFTLCAHHPLSVSALLLFLLMVMVPSLRPRDNLFLGACGLSWLGGFLSIAVQGKFFVYHYVFIFLPSVMSLLLFFSSGMRDQRIAFVQAHAYVAGALSLFTLHLFVLASYQTTYRSKHDRNDDTLRTHLERTWSYKAAQTQNETIYSLVQDAQGVCAECASILYLDSGLGPFIFDKPSACKHFYPLPLARLSSNVEGIKGLRAFREAKECFTQFDGDAIYDGGAWVNSGLSADAELKSKYAMLLNSYEKSRFPGLYLKKKNH